MQTKPVDAQTASTSLRSLLMLFCLAMGFTLGWAVLTSPTESTGLADLVQTNLQNSGVTNPVTAVLLNFRGYDTLLEVGVLLLAVFGVWSLRTAQLSETLTDSTFAGPILIFLVRLLVPLMILVGGYLLWAGAHAPGGAFQGGAVLGAAWVLLMLSDRHLPPQFRGWPLRAVLVLGFVVFLMVASGVMTANGRLLEYPRNWAGSLILLVESALTLSISFILASLFAGRPMTQFSRAVFKNEPPTNAAGAPVKKLPLEG